MSLEAGRVVARVEADVSSLKQGMADAQRTTERTANALINHVNRIEREYKTSVAAIKDSMARGLINRAEMERAGREAALAFNRGVTKSIDFSTRHGIVNDEVYQRLAGSLKDVGDSATRAAPGINTIRGSFASLVSQLTPVPPQIATITSAFSSLFVGSAAVAGALAGVAAVAGIFHKLSEKSREAKKDVEEALKVLQGFEKQQLGPEVAARAVTATTRADMARVFEEIQKTLRLRGAEGFGASAMVEAHLTDLMQQYARMSMASAAGETQVTNIQTENAEDRARELAELRRKQFEREMAELRAHFSAKMRLFREQMQEWARAAGMVQTAGGWNAGIPLTPIGRGATMIQGRGAVRAGAMPTFPIIRTVEPLSAPGRRIASQREGAEGIFGPLRDNLRRMFDPKQIISGLATGGISTAASLLGDFAVNLLGFSSKAKEAARIMKLARTDFSKDLDAFLISLTGTDAQKRAQESIGTITGFIREWEELYNKGQRLKAPDFKTLDELIAWMGRLLEGNITDPATVEAWKKIIEAARLLKVELGKTADAVDKTVASLTNVPTGFKIALARFNATTGVPVPPVPFLPGPPRRDMPLAGRTIVIQQMDVHGVEDLDDLVEKVEVGVARKIARGGTSLTLGYL